MLNKNEIDGKELGERIDEQSRRKFLHKLGSAVFLAIVVDVSESVFADGKGCGNGNPDGNCGKGGSGGHADDGNCGTANNNSFDTAACGTSIPGGVNQDHHCQVGGQDNSCGKGPQGGQLGDQAHP